MVNQLRWQVPDALSRQWYQFRQTRFQTNVRSTLQHSVGTPWTRNMTWSSGTVCVKGKNLAKDCRWNRRRPRINFIHMYQGISSYTSLLPENGDKSIYPSQHAWKRGYSDWWWIGSHGVEYRRPTFSSLSVVKVEAKSGGNAWQTDWLNGGTEVTVNWVMIYWLRFITN